MNARHSVFGLRGSVFVAAIDVGTKIPGGTVREPVRIAPRA
jgi:hypothetical protein